MPKPSLRDKIIDAGVRVLMERGYCGASVRDVVRAARVPQGSFTNHFPSKEAFGVAVLDRYAEMVRRNLNATLLDKSRGPARRLSDWFDLQLDFLNTFEMRTGCLIGNLSIDATTDSPLIRDRLQQVYEEIHTAVESCLRDAKRAGALSKAVRVDETARFLYASLQGAVLTAKVQRSRMPFQRFKRFAFSHILQLPAPPVRKGRRSVVDRPELHW